MKKAVISLVLLGFLMFSIFPIASVRAGVGIVWNQESALVPENSNVCLTYGIYNPWPQESYVKIQLSDPLQAIAKAYSSKVTTIPANTSHDNSVPVKFCFRTPKVYNETCLLFNTFLCKQTCSGQMKEFRGDVQVVQLSTAQVESGGSGGSSTAMSVSAPLNVKVKCVAHGTNYSIVFLLIGIIALAILIFKFRKRIGSGKRKQKKKK